MPSGDSHSPAPPATRREAIGSLSPAPQSWASGPEDAAPCPAEAVPEFSPGIVLQDSPSAAVQVDTCWSRIGVQGDKSCPQLADQVHCRNCPTYTHAGTLLLNRPVPAGYRRDWTVHFAGEKKRAAATNTSATIFRIGTEWLALDTRLVQEIAERRPMHSLPHRRLGVVLGLVNVRGELILCGSLARLLQLGLEVTPEASPRAFHRLIVLSADAQRFAFPVDEVHGVQRFDLQDLRPPPVTVAHDRRSITRGVLRWREHAVAYLDSDALLGDLSRSLA